MHAGATGLERAAGILKHTTDNVGIGVDVRGRKRSAIEVAVVGCNLDDVVRPEQDASEYRSHVHQDVVRLGAVTDNYVAREARFPGAVWVDDLLVCVFGDWVQVDPAQVGRGDELTSAIAAVGEQVVEAANWAARPLLSGLNRTVEAGIVEGEAAITQNGRASWDLNQTATD